MKYNFDEIIDRRHDKGSFSAKYRISSPENLTNTNTADDRLCFFLADMDFRVAPCILEGMQEVINHGILGYSICPPEYFEAVQRWMRDRFDWNIDTKHIFVHSGAHGAIVDCMEKFTKPGDGIIVLQPTYYYRNDVSSVGRHYIGVRMKNDNGYYTIDWDKFEEACKEPTNTMFIIQQPYNPTGRVWTIEEIKKMGEICEKYNVLILSDEVHMDIKRHNITVEPFMKVLGSKNVIAVTGINKTFNLAGLAVTNTIIENEDLLAKFSNHRNFTTPFGMAACISAYTKGDDWVDALNDYLDETIDYVVDRLHKELPKIKVWKPEGTYILWMDFSAYNLTSEELDEKILNQANISFSDGKGLECADNELYRRMCVTSPKSVCKEVIDRLVKVLG